MIAGKKVNKKNHTEFIVFQNVNSTRDPFDRGGETPDIEYLCMCGA
jgi:hypothetical protein